MTNPIRSAVNKAAHLLAGIEARRIRQELLSALEAAKSKGATAEDLQALLNDVVRAARARDAAS